MPLNKYGNLGFPRRFYLSRFVLAVLNCFLFVRLRLAILGLASADLSPRFSPQKLAFKAGALPFKGRSFPTPAPDRRFTRL